ncbi:LysR family transcriptional regulator [Psychrobacillus sp. NPDC096623]|uniref:LysR family transcriptional regulator n=1 Tax=Psychrobacillus sp. NPDC096623 TaxID=3364492 RepID=UPI00381B990A
MIFQNIDTFLMVAQCKSLSGAAKELHCAQTTVSQRIKNLEDEFGYQLLERGKGKKEIILTPMGEEYYKMAEEWNRILHEARLIQARGEKLSITTGAVDSINNFLLPKVIQNLNNNQLNLQLSIHTLHSVHLYSEVEKRQLDIAFSLQNRAHPNVQVEKYFEAEMVVLISINNDNFKSEKIHPKDLDSNYELFMPFGLEYQAWHAYWWDPLATSRVRIDCTPLMIGLLQNPSQWAIVPKHIAEGAAETGNYKFYNLEDPAPPYTVYKLTHKKATSLTRKSIDIFDKYFKFAYD